MWKCITRGLRAPFEKGSWSNLTSTAATDQSRGNAPCKDKTSQLPCSLRFVPCFLEVFQRHLAQFGLQSGYNEGQKKDKHNKSSNKSSTGESFRSESINFQPCAILGAVGWSGVLVLGWTILQPWYKHEKRRKPLAEFEVNPDAVKRYACLYKLLVYPALSQPVHNHVLPPRLTLISDDKQLQSSSPTQSIPDESPSSSESDSKTIEEAFDEAAEEVRKVHERAIGEAENRLGISCLSHKKGGEAIGHFKNALALNHAPAAFNLGQCHELGIGTKQDFVQAAQFYQIASDLGHATATYNLGVFYAHGWGGLAADIRKAKSLFLTAAALGQTEAQIALNLEKNNKPVVKKSEKRIPDDFESRLALDFFNINNISLSFTNKEPKPKDNFKQFKNISEYRPPQSSLSSSPVSSSASLSPPSSSSLLSTLDNPLFFHQNIDTIEESSEDHSGISFENQWQAAIELANMNGNSATLYRLAVCYESSPSADPELVIQLYRMAADHGHQRAKQYLDILEDHYSLGTLNEYLKKSKRNSSVADCTFYK